MAGADYSLHKRDNYKAFCILENNHFVLVSQFNVYTQDLGNCNKLSLTLQELALLRS